MNLLTVFINQVFSLNAANGRDAKPPLTYKEIKDTMSEMIWTKGLEKSANCGGRDPYASSSSSVPQAPKQGGLTPHKDKSSAGKSSPSGSRGSKSDGSGKSHPNARVKTATKMDPCRMFNTAAGCQRQPCKYPHACNRYKNDSKMC